MKIEKITVIGSGTMGSAIAAHCVNAGFDVTLLDIVADGTDRNAIVDKGFTNIQTIKPAAFADNKLAKNIRTGNLTDNINWLKETDWIIEAIIERIDIKQELYEKINKNKSKNTIVSSNTSTIALSRLIEKMSDEDKSCYLITHFFNPPRYMKLVELVPSKYTKPSITDSLKHTITERLGKTVVMAKDTPGFIANRLGCYWLEISIREAIKLNIAPSVADAIMGKAFGFPNTGVFGLYDLIGLDVMEMIKASLQANLPKTDPFNKIQPDDVVNKLIMLGFLGKKKNSGFYRINTLNDGKKIKEMWFNSDYINSDDYKDEVEKINNMTLNDLFEDKGKIGEFVRNTMPNIIQYAASLVDIIADNIDDIDSSMRTGYGWKYGFFELIDLIGINSCRIDKNGIFSHNLKLYKDYQYLTTDGVYKSITKDKALSKISDYKFSIIEETDSARLIKIDSILIFEIKTKICTLTPLVHNAIINAVKMLEYDQTSIGMIIYTDEKHFSAGGDLKTMLAFAEKSDFKSIDEYITLGQTAINSIKNSKKPVISAVRGYALGGGLELSLACSYAFFHLESNAGLVETKVGLIPAWGGLKESIYRSLSFCTNELEFYELMTKKMKMIASAEICKSFYQIKESFFHYNAEIVMHDEMLLTKAIDLLKTGKIEKQPHVKSINISKEKVIDILYDAKSELKLELHNSNIADDVINILSSIHESEESIMHMEKICFMKLIKTKETQEMIRKMVQN